MGVLTNIDEDYDDNAQLHRIFITTRFAISSRATLNRIAGRAALGTGVGQRTLVASAYDELGIDLVWNAGLGVAIPPEEKYEKAQDIEFRRLDIKESSQFGDILTNHLQDAVEFGEFDDEEVLYVWEIPYDVEGRR